MAQKDDSEDAVYKVDTVPPPDGDDDAYSAPTKVGVLASAVVNELIVAKGRAEPESLEVAATSQVKPRRTVRDENGNEVDQLDEDDIEAELAFPPPPQVPSPSSRSGSPSGATPARSTSAGPASGPNSAAPIKTLPIVPITPVATIRPAASTTSGQPQAPSATPKGLPPAVMFGGMIAALLVVVAIIFALKR